MSGKFSLIIANTEYNDPGLAQLTAPGKDAQEFWRVLNSPDIGAFDDVILVLNEDSATVNERIEYFFSEKKPDDLLLLYFSGHGVRDENGALYLAVKNTNRSRLRSTAVSSSFVREVMDQSRSKRQILILDCCNSGAFAHGTKAATGVSIGTATAFGAGYGHIVLTASDSTQYAWEGDKVIGSETENSLFTHYLVKGLEGEADLDGDGHITIDELYDYAYEKVRLATPKQTPSKFATKQQGEIILRQNMRIEDVKPVPLPAELLEDIESPRPVVRAEAVQQLIKLLNGKNLGLARSAREALERIAENDDSRNISRTAYQALEALKQADVETAEGQPDKLESEQKAEAERLITKKAEEERAAKAEAEGKAKEEAERIAAQKAKAEADRKAKEEANRLAAQKVEEVRIAKAKAERKAKEEADRLAAQKADEERVAKAKAEKERKAKEEAERLFAKKAEEERLAKARAEEARKAMEKAPSVALKSEPVPAAAVQKKPVTKVVMYGIAGVVVLAIVGIGIGALSRGGNNNTPNSNPTKEALVEPTAIQGQVVQEPTTLIPLTGPTPTSKPTLPTPTAVPQDFFTEEFESGFVPENWHYFTFGDDTSKLVIQQEDDYLLFDLGHEELYVYYVYDPYLYSNVSLTMVAENRGRNNNTITLFCHFNNDGSEWYEFNVESGGIWYLLAYKDGWNELADGGYAGLQATNEYSLTCEENTLTAYINGKKVASFTDSTYAFKEGRIGFNISSYNVLPITVAVHSLEIAQP